MSLTQEDVIQAYQVLLGRTPAEVEIEHTLKHFSDVRSLHQAILMSDEFSNRYGALTKARDALQQPTLIHLHIPKTAGTTLVQALLREETLQPSAAIHDHMMPDLSAMPMARRRALRYVHGHLDMTVSQIFGAPHRILCVLRRPGPRIYSFYRFILRTTDHPSHAELVKLRLSFGEYLEYSLENENHRIEIDNGQLRRLSSNLNTPKFGMSHTYVVPALHAVTKPSMILGFAEHMPHLLSRLRQEGYLTASVVENHNVAPENPGTNSYAEALANLTENQKAIFTEFTVWDEYFYDLCMNVLPPDRQGN